MWIVVFVGSPNAGRANVGGKTPKNANSIMWNDTMAVPMNFRSFFEPIPTVLWVLDCVVVYSSTEYRYR